MTASRSTSSAAALRRPANSPQRRRERDHPESERETKGQRQDRHVGACRSEENDERELTNSEAESDRSQRATENICLPPELAQRPPPHGTDEERGERKLGRRSHPDAQRNDDRPDDGAEYRAAIADSGVKRVQDCDDREHEPVRDRGEEVIPVGIESRADGTADDVDHARERRPDCRLKESLALVIRDVRHSVSCFSVLYSDGVPCNVLSLYGFRFPFSSYS